MHNTRSNTIRKALNDDGYYVIKKAINNPHEYLIKLRNNNNPHSKIMWDLRLATKQYFAKIWESNKLICSFDGNSLDSKFSLTWHVDQNMSHGDGISCVQGVLALTDSNSTELLAKSHKYFKEFGPRNTSYEINEFESYCISNLDDIWNKKLKKEVPELKPGDMLLFDSRIIHRVIARNIRSVAYISMVPRSFVSKEIQKKRKMGFNNGIQTTHWCTRFINVNNITCKPEVEINDLV